jgi:hypothetical protein
VDYDLLTVAELQDNFFKCSKALKSMPAASPHLELSGNDVKTKGPVIRAGNFLPGDNTEK